MPIHMGTYTAHVVMTVIITMLLTEHGHIHPWALAGAVGFMVLYLLLFRLTLPYSLVWRNPERTLLMLLPVFDAYARALRPLASALRRRAAAPAADDTEANGAARLARRCRRRRCTTRTKGASSTPSRASRVTQVRDVMTPRPDIVALAATSTIGDLRRVLRETKYSRVPVYNENLDDIVGVVSVRDLVEYEGPPDDPLLPLVREAYLVPETKKVAELLKEFQARRITFALAIDEYGGISGLVTVEDIVEEIVGEIKDEYDLEAEPISIEADGAVLVAGPGERGPAGAGPGGLAGRRRRGDGGRAGGLRLRPHPAPGREDRLPRVRGGGGGRRAQARPPRALPPEARAEDEA